ncbi:MAG: hypothetical protein R3Y04_01340 [Rikenellaceae bacterium]
MKKSISYVLLMIMCLSTHYVLAQRWQIADSGAIVWQVNEGESHFDHIEMAGEKVATVLRWGVEPSGSFAAEWSIVFPMLRTIPNNTHASLMQRFSPNLPSMLVVNGRSLNSEKVTKVAIDGSLVVESYFATETYELGREIQRDPVYVVLISREIAPSPLEAMVCEKCTIKNITNSTMSILIPEVNTKYQTIESSGVEGSYTIAQKVQGAGSYVVNAGQQITFYSYIEGYSKNETAQKVNVNEQLEKRKDFVNQMWSSLLLETPDSTINSMFAFAKVRASESIYKTSGGYMHGPGGESYYAAIWANDQAEYINPFFPFLGYDIGNESALNSYRHFARFMNDDFNAIPSSIIAEGKDIWNGAGDRGDAAMIAYGASRYALSRGSLSEAQELWPLIEWCLEYCNRKLNSQGVVTSDSDELEGRFPAGKANLSTSSLYYDALISASYLANSLNMSRTISNSYNKQAKELRSNIEKYFGANVEGFDTYQYYEGGDILRSWICIPLTVDIFDRKEQTIKALLSDRLWSEDGVLTQAGTTTFWDRSTLYTLRGMYAAGEADLATDFIKVYSRNRLLGDHVPYAIEAYPEGGKRHLSAESGLYCRVFTEGVFGIRPTGFSTFTINPQLPAQWENMSLKSIKAFGSCFDIEVFRSSKGVESRVIKDGKVVAKGVGKYSVKL